jgi:hypothetical protein
MTDTSGGLHFPKGFAAAANGSVPRKVDASTIEWFDPTADTENPHVFLYTTNAAIATPTFTSNTTWYSLESSSWTLDYATNGDADVLIPQTGANSGAIKIPGVGHYLVKAQVQIDTAVASTTYKLGMSLTTTAGGTDAGTFDYGVPLFTTANPAVVPFTIVGIYYIKVVSANSYITPMMMASNSLSKTMSNLVINISRVHA